MIHFCFFTSILALELLEVYLYLCTHLSDAFSCVYLFQS
jgi:hypothetical protein